MNLGQAAHGALERLKTETRIAHDVLQQRAFVETLIPWKRNQIDATIIRADGRVEHLAPSYNSRINAGANWQASLMGSAAGTPANYMALSTATLTVATGDTTLTSEIVTGTNAGLARALGTYQNYTAPGSVGGAASYQITKTFTSSGAATVVSAAMFNASSAGTMFVEANLSSSAVLATNDQLVLTWTVNI